MANTDNVHIGHLIKSVFDESGMTVSELARKLHCERTNVYTISRRRTVDVELLAMLSEILNYNFLDDAMKHYGLTATFSPKLELNIGFEGFTAEKVERLKEVLSEFIEKA
ncbi:MAG: helix-turn-helix transcriptional regulator [Bacteroidales bacterium]|nr:helix-turn-helix transcriptional regulator [Bacteroidales bacterium]MBQ8959534.1 helix-turn-helix transcriptional regulator [Bacteroidales bacterium]